MKQFKKLIGNTRGEMYIDVLLKVLVIGFMAALILSIIGIGVEYAKVVVYTNTLVDNAKVYGEIDSDPVTYSSLASNDGLDSSKLTYSWSAQYFDQNSGKLAFQKPLTLTVTYSCGLPLMGGGGIAIPLKYAANGVSEVFWK